MTLALPRRAPRAGKLLAAALVLVCGEAAATVRLGTDVVPTSQTVALHVDPRKDDYTGSVQIELEVKKPVDAFRFHAEDLTITSMRLSGAEVTHAKGDDGTVIVTATAPLKTGRQTLTIDFTNRFNRQAVGLYKMLTREGEPYLFTQFQAIDARRAFPVWDEPGFKIPYQLTVTIPAQYDAVSNTPVADESNANGAKTIRFARTKPLPSYLIALAVGRFDYTPITGLGVPGRVVAPKGQGRLTKHAAESTPPILAAMEKYFGSKYPFEKIDLIAVPEYWAGAMENPGAITYRDTVLLLDPVTATPAQRQNLIRVTAHELAHMWFGDLVTMEWWDDFWLNESFADWMGDKITDQLHPEFGHLVGELRGIQRVMNSDARATTDPIRGRRDVSPVEAMRNVGIAYDKGKAVLTMFESWIGPEKFRQGVLDHLKNNAWGNANASEFFASLARHAPKGTVEAMETFIAQPGIPLVDVQITGANEVRLTQTRLSTGKAAPQTWRIPVTMRYSDGRTTRTAAVLLDEPAKTVKLEGARIEWLFPHANAAGYYRWRMPADAMTALAGNATKILEPKERLAFIGNAGALFSNGTMHGDAYLELLGRFAADSDPHVLSALMAALTQVRTTFDSAQTRPLFAAYLRRTLGPVLDRIGLTPGPGEAGTVTNVRPELLALLGGYGRDERVLAFVREQVPRYLENPSSVHPSIAGVLLATAATTGNEALFEEFRRRFESATLPAERSRFLGALGRFGNPALKKKAREYALTGPVRANELLALFGGAETPEERDELFEWVTANFDAILKRLPPAFASGLPSIAAGCEPERVARARQFFAERNIPGTERRMAQIEEQVNECAALRAQEMAAVAAYLATSKPCDPGLALVNATLWVRSDAESRAAALQTYAAARRALDAALSQRGDKPPAVILDLDETALNNEDFAAHSIANETTFTFGDDWASWVAQSAATAVPGAKEFLLYAQSRGVTPFYITNRTAAMEAATRTNLQKLGFPLGTTEDTLLTRGERDDWNTTDKSTRRDHVASRYRVLLLLGDDLNDFAPRQTALDADPALWGTQWFIVSNPIYGSWESAATGGSGTPCEQLQKKLDALQ